MNLQTYVAVHDAALIAECEREGRFSQLGEDCAYLFLGHRPDSYHAGSVIIPNRLADNMEHLPQFYDFTGWWALARHRMIVRPHVMFLQYDMEVVSSTLEADVNRLLDDGPGPVAFTAGHNLAGNYMLMIGGFEKLFREGMAAIGAADMDAWEAFNEWPTTQGLAWRTEDFYDFMTWFRPLFDVFASSTWAGHLAERTVKAWCCERGIEPRYLPGVIRHETRDCHGTGALMAGNEVLYQERARLFAS